MSIIGASATELLQRLDRGDISSVEITRAYLGWIARHDGQVQAFLHVDQDQALARARACDQQDRKSTRLNSSHT